MRWFFMQQRNGCPQALLSLAEKQGLAEIMQEKPFLLSSDTR
jgi:hypothetical protein